jgi:hypothetical protein
MTGETADLNTRRTVGAVLARQRAGPKPNFVVLSALLRLGAARRLQLLVSLFAVSLVLLVGCRARSDRLAISGEVTLDGAPLDSGTIRLTSTGAGKLFASGAIIENGKFHVPQEKGLPPGSYHVVISAPDAAAPPVVYKGMPGEPRLPPTAPERIPPEYNSNSKQTIEVTADGKNDFKFDIVRHGSR